MRTFYALLALLPLTTSAQTTWTVHVGGSTQSPPAPYYTPQNLTINVGDIVHWVRDNGTHNINGSTTTFPGNPESFFSGTPQNTSFPWDFTFDIPGVYNYHCDQQGHSATQFGTITVLNPNGVEE
ncbi:MAG TPA: plastocyanin/azurin family copper-binding protein, partial [Flavobacteriales bacterium]|nr:plastocyanin/azurin family copper-binding protein [Flavobacteriales bacterium]